MLRQYTVTYEVLYLMYMCHLVQDPLGPRDDGLAAGRPGGVLQESVHLCQFLAAN